MRVPARRVLLLLAGRCVNFKMIFSPFYMRTMQGSAGDTRLGMRNTYNNDILYIGIATQPNTY